MVYMDDYTIQVLQTYYIAFHVSSGAQLPISLVTRRNHKTLLGKCIALIGRKTLCLKVILPKHTH